MSARGDINRTKKLAEAALAAMASHGVAPTPPNFMVWYTHLTGENPELSRAIEGLINNKQGFSEGQNAQLYDQYFASGSEIGDLATASARLDGVISKVLSELGVAGEDATRYTEALTAFNIGLRQRDLGAVQKSVETVVSETRRMVERNQILEKQLATSSTEINSLRQDIEDLRQVTLMDALTGIANRKCFDQRLREATRDAQEAGTPLALVMVDIDHFKRFNDTYGHPLGDEVLRLVARMLRDGTKGRDLVARYGGEEFAIILANTKLENGVIVADQLRESVARKQVMRKGTGETLGAITLSMGVAAYVPGEKTDELIARADQALYLAKRTGRNRVANEKELDGGLEAKLSTQR
jgi:diguanylate cyclase